MKYWHVTYRESRNHSGFRTEEAVKALEEDPDVLMIGKLGPFTRAEMDEIRPYVEPKTRRNENERSSRVDEKDLEERP